MLTSTYTLVALSVEQTSVRAALHMLAEGVHALPVAPTVALIRASSLCAGLRKVYDNCHWRKLDKFLIPALRRDDAALDGLLRDLEGLSNTAAEAMTAAEACVGNAVPAEGVARAPFCAAIERCIAALRRRLEREEDELFPLARTVVGRDAWFAIANQMLAHDAYAREKRDARATSQPRRPGQGPAAASLSAAHAAAHAAAHPVSLPGPVAVASLEPYRPLRGEAKHGAARSPVVH